MNEADSKKLEEIEKRYAVDIPGGDVTWLISFVKEQDREIERLRSYIDGNDKDAEIDELETRAEKAEAELDVMIELEASVCPEDFGCHEYIPKLEARVKELEQELLWATDACERAEAYATEQEDIIKDLQADVKQLEEKLQVIRDSRANATYKSIMAGKKM